MTDAEYCDAVRYLWVHSEGDFDAAQFDAVFQNHGRRISARNLMTGNEQTEFDALPDPITVYRGAQQETVDGISWTLNISVAEKFARRAAGESATGEGCVVTGTCAKREVLAYFNDNDLMEAEILVNPGRVVGKRIMARLSTDRPIDKGHRIP